MSEEPKLETQLLHAWYLLCPTFVTSHNKSCETRGSLQAPNVCCVTFDISVDPRQQYVRTIRAISKVRFSTVVRGSNAAADWTNTYKHHGEVYFRYLTAYLYYNWVGFKRLAKNISDPWSFSSSKDMSPAERETNNRTTTTAQTTHDACQCQRTKGDLSSNRSYTGHKRTISEWLWK